MLTQQKRPITFTNRTGYRFCKPEPRYTLASSMPCCIPASLRIDQAHNSGASRRFCRLIEAYPRGRASLTSAAMERILPLVPNYFAICNRIVGVCYGPEEITGTRATAGREQTTRLISPEFLSGSQTQSASLLWAAGSRTRNSRAARGLERN